MTKSKVIILIAIIIAIIGLVIVFTAPQSDNENEDVPKIHTVSFNSDGGTIIDAQSVENGKFAKEPEAPTKDGFIFVGWYLGDTAWSFKEMPVSKDMTLIAVWREGTLPPQDTDGGAADLASVTISFRGAEDYAIRFSFDEVGGGKPLADGTTYYNGDLKPTWSQISKNLGVELKQSNKDFDVIIAPVSYLNQINDELLPLSAYPKDAQNHNYSYLTLASEKKRSTDTLIMMNEQIIKTLLDGNNDFSNTNTADAATYATQFKYVTPYIPADNFTIDVMDENGNQVSRFCNLLKSGTIIGIMNARSTSLTPSSIVNYFRDYIDTAHGGTYGTIRSDLFLGDGAAWCADELVALLRAAKANANLLSMNNFYGIVVNEKQSLDELSVLLFGKIDDARIKAMQDEGLIYVGDADGVMYYGGASELREGYRVTLPPIVKTDEGNYTRYADVRLGGTAYGIAVVSSVASKSSQTLAAAAKLIEYLVSDEGASLLKYGTPSIHDSTNGKFDFFGDEIPRLSDSTVAAARQSGLPYEEYAKNYLGIATDIYNCDGFAYQCMSDSERQIYKTVRAMLLLCERR